jgi:tetratricopeptide (TPR) repeat protein
MSSGIGAVFVAAAAIVSMAGAPVQATVAAQEDATEESLELCHRAERSPQRAEELLERSLRLAEEALAADESNARAHLALFCSLGKQLETGGIGFGALGKVRRLRKEIDLALELDPDDADILAAKGAMLVELPSMFGGDVEEGAALLQRSLAIRSGNERARHYLEMALESRAVDSDPLERIAAR